MKPIRSANRRRRPVKRCSHLRQGYGGEARLIVGGTLRLATSTQRAQTARRGPGLALGALSEVSAAF